MRVSSTASVEALGILGESRRQQRDHLRRENEGDNKQDHLAGEKQGEHAVSEQLCGIGAALLTDARVGRHERGVEGTLGKDRAEMIWQPQRDKKRIRDRPGAEHSSQDDVARKAGKPRYQRQAADGEDASNHWPRPLSCDRPRALLRAANRPSFATLVILPGSLPDAPAFGPGIRRLATGIQAPSARRTAAMMRSWVASSR